MEAPNAKGQSNLIVGLFVFVTLVVAAGFIVFMGGSSVFSSEMKLSTVFSDARGLNVGAPVFLSGVDVGRVTNKSLLAVGTEKGVIVTFSVDASSRNRMTDTATATISSAGMLGDKTLVIFEGEGGNLLKDGDRIMAKAEKDLDSYLAQGGAVLTNVKEITESLALIFKDGKTQKKVDQILANLEKASENLKKNTEGEWGPKLDRSLTRMESVVTKIDKGQGTLGALINDTSLHEDLRVLLGGAKRSKIVRFFVKQSIQNSDAKGGSDQAAPKASQ